MINRCKLLRSGGNKTNRGFIYITLQMDGLLQEFPICICIYMNVLHTLLNVIEEKQFCYALHLII